MHICKELLNYMGNLVNLFWGLVNFAGIVILLMLNSHLGVLIYYLKGFEEFWFIGLVFCMFLD